MGMLAESKHLTTFIEAEQGDRPQNNKMQMTRSGHSRWRPSHLILVLDGP